MNADFFTSRNLTTAECRCVHGNHLETQIYKTQILRFENIPAALENTVYNTRTGHGTYKKAERVLPIVVSSLRQFDGH
jgi:hypothetical protein